jgi:hypothetical protein
MKIKNLIGASIVLAGLTLTAQQANAGITHKDWNYQQL